jgi:hypothetical protein
MTADPSATYAALRDETAGMFGYDLADLSLTQGLQIDLVSLLRLEVDTMQGKVLAGETVDLVRLVAAHGLLQKMLPPQALVAPAPAATNDDAFAGAREELERFLAGRAEALEHREQRESARLLEENTRLRDEIAKLQAPPASPTDVSQSGTKSVPKRDTTPPPPATLEAAPREAERLPRVRTAESEKAWRDNYYGTGGVQIAPAWPPPSDRYRK